MIRRQSNNQWSGGMASHHAPKIPNAKIRWKCSLLDSIFWDKDGILLIDYLPKGQTLNVEYYSYSAGAIEGHFEGKTPRGGHQGCLVLARQCSGSPGTCNPED
jgi:hypothetical protein